MRLSWSGPGEPELGDLVWEDPEELHRGYLVVGVEEPSRAGARWVVFLERLAWEDFLWREGRAWSFVRDRR